MFKHNTVKGKELHIQRGTPINETYTLNETLLALSNNPKQALTSVCSSIDDC